MQELFQWINNSVLYIEGLALVVGVILHYKSRHQGSKFVLAYLAIIVAIELIGQIVTVPDNQWMYNLLSLMELIILFSMYYLTTNKSSFTNILIILFALCSILFCYEIFILNKGPLIYLSYTWGLTSICIAIAALCYIVFFVQSDKIMELKKDLLIWVSIGLLFYHLCNLPITVLTHVLEDMDVGFNIYLIQPFAGILMYFSFIIGFIWSRKSTNT